MEFLINIFNTILYQPLFNALILIYKYLSFQDLGIAIIILTALIKILFYPLGTKAIKNQKILSELQPKIKEIQERYKKDREKQTREILNLYKKEKINPFSGLLPLLIQLPILIALYQIFRKGFHPEEMNNLYYFISQPDKIDPTFFGFINLNQPNTMLAFLAGLSQFFQSKMIQNKDKKEKTGKKQSDQFSKMIQTQMIYFFPIFTILILWKLPSAIGLYWLVTTIFSIFQQYFILKKQSL